MVRKGYIRAKDMAANTITAVSQFIRAVNIYIKNKWFIMGIEEYIKEMMLTGSTPFKLLAYCKYLVCKRDISDENRFIIIVDKEFYDDFRDFVTKYNNEVCEVTDITIKKSLAFLKEYNLIAEYKDKQGRRIRGKYIVNQKHCYIGNNANEIINKEK